MESIDRKCCSDIDGKLYCQEGQKWPACLAQVHCMNASGTNTDNKVIACLHSSIISSSLSMDCGLTTFLTCEMYLNIASELFKGKGKEVRRNARDSIGHHFEWRLEMRRIGRTASTMKFLIRTGPIARLEM